MSVVIGMVLRFYLGELSSDFQGLGAGSDVSRRVGHIDAVL